MTQTFTVESCRFDHTGKVWNVSYVETRQPDLTTEKSAALVAYLHGLRNYVWYFN